MTPEERRRLDMVEMEVKNLRRDLDARLRQSEHNIKTRFEDDFGAMKRFMEGALAKIPDLAKVESVLDRVAKRLAKAEARDEARDEADAKEREARRHRRIVMAVLVPVVGSVFVAAIAAFASHWR